MDIKKLLVRSASGLLYVAIITVACIYGEIGIILLAGLLAALATVEFAKMCREADAINMPTLIMDTVMCVCLACGKVGIPLFVWLCLLVCRLVLELYTENPNPVKNLSHSLMAQLYIGLPLLLMTWLPGLIPQDYTIVEPRSGTLTHNYYEWPMLLVVFILIWVNDTGAFLVGCLSGRHKLFERISPKKTWEGFFGGVAFTLIASTLFCFYGGSLFSMQGNLPFWIGLGIVVSVFGTWGDLVESLMKRTLGLKDSGNLIPGHGGILDRIDSLLLVAPAVFIYLIGMAPLWYEYLRAHPEEWLT